MMKSLLLSLNYSVIICGRKSRQATFHKPKHYEAIPYYIKPNFIDIHDTYKLRTL
jgi:hypothetical protein